MKCPDAIADIILEIMRIGLLRIRHHAASGTPERCVIEADHIHNLPNLLRDYTPDLLRFYWEIERQAFERHSDVLDLASFRPLWERLCEQQNLRTPVEPFPVASASNV